MKVTVSRPHQTALDTFGRYGNEENPCRARFARKLRAGRFMKFLLGGQGHASGRAGHEDGTARRIHREGWRRSRGRPASAISAMGGWGTTSGWAREESHVAENREKEAGSGAPPHEEDICTLM
jgi:hypothetical protein